MDEKVYFKLRQTHYPPPPEDSIFKGSSESNAPIRLGHLIRDLKSIDTVINTEAVESFPPSMQVFKTRMINFNWGREYRSELGGALNAAIPIAIAAGTTAKASIEAAFRPSIDGHEAYDALDTYIVQPTQSYVNAVMTQPPMSHHSRSALPPTFFMVTGLCVARQGTVRRHEGNQIGGGGNVDAGIDGVANASANANTVNATSTAMQGRHVTDFVWAVRLAKIHKGILSANWSVGTYTKGATFSDGEEEVDIAAVVDGNGLSKEDITVIEDEQMDCAIVL